MKKFLIGLFYRLLEEDIDQQVKVIETIAIAVFIVFFCSLIYLWQWKVDISVPGRDYRKLVAQRTIIEILLEKR